MATALLEGASIKRADGKAGKLKWKGPFPSGLTVRFAAG